MLVAVSGCDCSEGPAASQTASAAEESPNESEPVEAVPEGESEPEPEPHPAPEPPELPIWAHAFEWTPTPSVDAIPAGPVRGVSNDTGFETMALYFEPRFETWALVIADRPLDEHSGTLPAGTQSVNVTDLPAQLTVGIHRRELSTGGGFWQIALPDDPSRTTSWNTRNAYVLELTRWEVRPWDPEGPMYQAAGSASGRLAVVYEGGGGGFQSSWVAGTFENAPVRYRGRPRWVEP